MGFEKNVMTARCNGSDKMRYSRMVQRLASANPNDRRGAGDGVANLFMRNRMRGTGVQDFRGIGKREQVSVQRGLEYSRDTDFR